MSKWVEVARRGENHHVLYLDLMIQTMTGNKVGETFTSGFAYVPSRFRQFAGARWFSQDEIENYTKLMKKASAEKKVLGMGIAWEMQSNQTRKFASGIRGKDFSNASTKELLDAFGGFCTAAINHWGHAYHYMMLNRFLPDEVALEITELIPDAVKRNECLNVLFATEKPTEIKQENAAFLEIALKLFREGKSPDGKEAAALVEEHLRKYAHLGRYYLRSRPYSHEDIFNRMRQLSPSEAERKHAELGEHGKAPERTRQIVKELDLQSEIVEKIYAIKQFAFAANYADESYGYLVECAAPLLLEIGNRLGLAWDELCSMRRVEIISMLEKGARATSAFKAELNERLRDHAIVLEDGQVRLIYGHELAGYYSENSSEQEKIHETKELKGLAVSPGKAKGPAALIISSKDLDKVRKGDVLVASMTTPEFVPAMEKACAIVTDEGGMLCHAAIISRELRIPCVVGTRVATKAIRNGVLLSVDADSGKVEILGQKGLPASRE